ncbi:MAG: baseplate hub protein [Maricaulaceae bacterium]
MAISDQAFWSRKITFSLLGREGEDEIARELGSDLSVEFDVQKTRSAEPNKADIKLFNLSPATRNQIAGFSGGTAKGEFTKIRLAAGYAPNGKDNSEVIFEGYIRRFWHAKEDTDWVTYITAGDGDLDYRNVTVNRSFGKGTPYSDIVRYILSRMPDVGAGDLSGLSEMGVTDTGYTLAGWGKRFLDEIARKHDLRWSIQDGKMEIVSNSKVSDTVTIQRLRPAQYNEACELVGGSGMVGIPVVTEYGITVKSLMLPAIRPNAIIQVESLTRDATDEKALLTETEAGAGRYRVNAARYQGSNFGNDYYVTADCQAVKDGEVVRPDHKGHAVAADTRGVSRFSECNDTITRTTVKLNSPAYSGRSFAARKYSVLNGYVREDKFANIFFDPRELTVDELKRLFDGISDKYFRLYSGDNISGFHKYVSTCGLSAADTFKRNLLEVAMQIFNHAVVSFSDSRWKQAWGDVERLSVRANEEHICDLRERETRYNAFAELDKKEIYFYDKSFDAPIISEWGNTTIYGILAHEVAHFIYAKEWKMLGTPDSKYTEDQLHIIISEAAREFLKATGLRCTLNDEIGDSTLERKPLKIRKRCSPYSVDDFPTDVIDISGQGYSDDRRGLARLGPRLVGPFSTHAAVVADGIDKLTGGLSGTGTVSEGVTIFRGNGGFLGNNGYFRSIPTASGAFSVGGMPTSAGLGSGLSLVSSVIAISNSGVVIQSPTKKYVGVRISPRNNGIKSDTEPLTCYSTF